MQMPRSSAHRPCTSRSSSPKFSEICAVSCRSHCVKDSLTNNLFWTHTFTFNLDIDSHWYSVLMAHFLLSEWTAEHFKNATDVCLASCFKDTKGTFSWLCRKCVTAIGQLLIHVHSSIRRPTLVCTLLPYRAQEKTWEYQHMHICDENWNSWQEFKINLS